MSADPAIARRTLSLLDLTSLGDDDTDATIASLCANSDGRHGRVAAVCVWPRFVGQCRSALHGTGIEVATVANFPHGRPDLDTAAEETRRAVADGADEVDVVFPYAAWLNDHQSHARDMIAACKKAAADKKLKVILETGRLMTPSAIRGAADDAIEAGADFIKTSTGKTATSTSLEAAHIMLEAIKDAGRPVGLKPSGGIRTPEQAAAYLRLADHVMGAGWATPKTFRFGASGLLAVVEKVLDAEGERS